MIFRLVRRIICGLGEHVDTGRSDPQTCTYCGVTILHKQRMPRLTR